MINAFKTTSIAAALLLGASSLALAQDAGDGADTDSSQSTETGASPSQGQPGGPTGSEMQSSESSQLSEATVKSKLESEGYSNVTGVMRSGEKYEATAEKDGKPVKLFIDATTGTIAESEG